MLFLFRSAPEVEKRIHSELFRKFWRSRGTKEPAYMLGMSYACANMVHSPGYADDLRQYASLNNYCILYALSFDVL